MANREITSLRLMCLRSVGGKSCSAEKTFKCKKGRKESAASRLLRSLHDDGNIDRLLCFGKGAIRRANANDVDLNHPFIATQDRFPEHGNSALDCLQSYMDSLVELGRLDDSRLGINFWREWKKNVGTSNQQLQPRKRKRSSPELPEVGSLSLHNSLISDDTIEAMVKSGMGKSVGVLDLTGIQTITDDMISDLLCSMPNLQRLSLKNCRRLTGKSLTTISENLSQLTCLDIGGSYNITTAELLEILPTMLNLEEIYAGGLGWTDLSLEQLTSDRLWKGIGIGFSHRLTSSGLREAFTSQTDLERLSIPFCEQALEASTLGFMARSLSKVNALDIRGNSGINSLTCWFDGLVAAGAGVGELFVLARYSNITKASLEETKRIHPLHALDLTCILDGTGVGEGIRRK